MRKGEVQARVRQVEEAMAGTPKPLSTGSSNESVRASTGPGLAMLPFLTINDIIALRAAGYRGLQDIEERVLEVPDPAWVHVLELVRSGIARIQPQALIPPMVQPKKVEKPAPPPKVAPVVKVKVKPAAKQNKAAHKAPKTKKKAAKKKKKKKTAKKAKPAKKKTAPKRRKKR